MKKQKKNKSLEEIFAIYDSLLSTLGGECHEAIEDVQKEARLYTDEEKGKSFANKISAVILILAGIALVVIMFTQNKQVENLTFDVQEKKNIINRLQWSDSLFNKIMTVKIDSINNQRSIIYKTSDGEIVTYDKLSKSVDSLEKISYSLEGKITNLKREKDILDHFMERNSKGRYTYWERNGKILTYQDLMNECDSLLKKNNEKDIHIYKIEKSLEIIRKNYGIVIKQDGDKASVLPSKSDTALFYYNLIKDKKYTLSKADTIIILE